MLIKIAKYSSLSIMEVKTSDVIIPFYPQYLPKHAPLILQEAGCQRAGCCCLRTLQFSLLTMTDRYSNFNIISYTEDRHELRVTDTKCRLPDTMSATCEISISGADYLWKKHLAYTDDHSESRVSIMKNMFALEMLGKATFSVIVVIH